MSEEFCWKKEWVDMPEFVQEKQEPHAKIIVRFRNEEDLQKFAEAIGQPLTNKTKSIWFPALERGLNANKKWEDDAPEVPDIHSI